MAPGTLGITFGCRGALLRPHSPRVAQRARLRARVLQVQREKALADGGSAESDVPFSGDAERFLRTACAQFSDKRSKLLWLRQEIQGLRQRLVSLRPSGDLEALLVETRAQRIRTAWARKVAEENGLSPGDRRPPARPPSRDTQRGAVRQTGGETRGSPEERDDTAPASQWARLLAAKSDELRDATASNSRAHSLLNDACKALQNAKAERARALASTFGLGRASLLGIPLPEDGLWEAGRWMGSPA